jgi:hypothetical protein
MIINFEVENFKSIYEPIELSMISTADSSRMKNVIEDTNYKFNLLKIAAIYGPNASGKSSVLEAMGYLKFVVTNSFIIKPSDSISRSVSNKIYGTNEPTRLGIEFFSRKIRYKYELKLDQEQIYEERLYYYPKKQPKLVFDRTFRNGVYEVTAPSEQKLFNDFLEKTNQNRTLLSVASAWNHKVAKNAVDYLMQGIIVNSIDQNDYWLDVLKEEMYGDKMLTTVVVEAAKISDLGIEDIVVRRREKTSYAPVNYVGEHDHQNRKKEYWYDAFVVHTAPNGEIFELSLEDESDGTHKFLVVMNKLFQANRRSGVVMTDELTAYLHPHLVEAILALVQSVDSGLQLIFTTHNSSILDMDLLRRDQFWFTEKDEKTLMTELYSLSDLKVRKDEKLEKGYLLGRYGAVPYIEEGEINWQDQNADD